MSGSYDMWHVWVIRHVTQVGHATHDTCRSCDMSGSHNTLHEWNMQHVACVGCKTCDTRGLYNTWHKWVTWHMIHMGHTTCDTFTQHVTQVYQRNVMCGSHDTWHTWVVWHVTSVSPFHLAAWLWGPPCCSMRLDVFPFWGGCYSIVWMDHILSPLVCRGTHGSSCLLSVVGVLRCTWGCGRLSPCFQFRGVGTQRWDCQGV